MVILRADRLLCANARSTKSPRNLSGPNLRSASVLCSETSYNFMIDRRRMIVKNAAASKLKVSLFLNYLNLAWIQSPETCLRRSQPCEPVLTTCNDQFGRLSFHLESFELSFRACFSWLCRLEVWPNKLTILLHRILPAETHHPAKESKSIRTSSAFGAAFHLTRQP